eukprot:3249329-Pyramimonas_sp.AAC.1
MNGGLVYYDDGFAAGPHGIGSISPASAAARPVLSAWGLCAANTFFLNPVSFVGERGEKSCAAHTRSARSLQLHQIVSARDHRPVVLVAHTIATAAPLPARAARPNREAMHECVQPRYKRGEFISVVNDSPGNIYHAQVQGHFGRYVFLGAGACQ